MLVWFAGSTEGLWSTNSSPYSNAPSTGETWAQKLSLLNRVKKGRLCAQSSTYTRSCVWSVSPICIVLGFITCS